jgi:hypothetical protein
MAAHVFVHVGDAHVCASHPRNGDRLASLDQIIAAGERLPNLAAWLWPGDLFHQRSTPADRNALAARIQRMAGRAPVLLTVGNHETAEELEIFAKLDAAWPIVLFTMPGERRFDTATGAQACCFALPYPHKAGLVGAGVAHAELGHEAAHLLDPIFMLAEHDLRVAAELGQIPLFIGHVNVGGAITSSGQPSIGREIELHPAQLARLGPICKALNHIHKHQEIAGAVYAGSTSRHDYGEQELKGFVEWTFDDERGWSWRFRPLTGPEQYHVDGVLTRDGFRVSAINGAVVETVCQQRWTGIDIRCKYRFKQAEVGALDVAKVHAEFAGCRSLKLDPVPELEHEVRAPQIAAAATLEEKVAAYAQHVGMDALTPGVFGKLSALQAKDGAALLSELTGHLVPRGGDSTAQELAADRREAVPA